jgi:hypothetical protein
MRQYTRENWWSWRGKTRKIFVLWISHDGKLVQTRVRDQDVKKRRVVVDCYSMMGGGDMSDAELMSHCSTRKRLKMYHQKHCCHLIDICCINSYFLYKTTEGEISRLEFQYRLAENLILEYHRTEVRPTGRTSKTVPYAARIYCCYSFQGEPTWVLRIFQGPITRFLLSVSQPHVTLWNLDLSLLHFVSTELPCSKMSRLYSVPNLNIRCL